MNQEEYRMTIGALGAYSFQPYIYNTNAVSSASMNKLSKISDDVLDKKIDYSELADESRNVNPLKKGQTLDFQSMLEMQMQRGQNNAARIMRPTAESQADEEETAQTSDTNVTQFAQASASTQERVASENTADNANADNVGNSNNISYQMQQALNAYGMFMTA